MSGSWELVLKPLTATTSSAAKDDVRALTVKHMHVLPRP